MSAVEDPVAELEIRFARSEHLPGPALEVSWLLEPGSSGRGVARIAFEECSGRFSRLDLVIYDPSLEPPFEVVTGTEEGGPPPLAAVDVTPGRKAVAMVSIARGAQYLGPECVLGIPPAPPMAQPADALELELVACMVDRLSEGTLLDDLHDAGLRVHVDLFRLASRLGTLEVSRGRARWIEEGS